jgi:ankyrin repeat protein
MEAATARDEKLVKLLLINNADVNQKDNNGRTVVDIARKKRNKKVLALLQGES